MSWRQAAVPMACATTSGMRAYGLGAVLAALLLNSSCAEPRPERIVSLSLCTDQLVLVLADRRQIASVSYLAEDRDLSYLTAAAEGVSKNRGTVEEAMVLQPDLILAGPWGSYQAGKLLERLGHRVLFVPPAEDFDTIRNQVRQVAEAVGQPERGAAVIAAMDRTLAEQRRFGGAEGRETAVAYLAGGYTQGSGTLLDAVMQTSGLDNGAGRLGIAGFAPLPLESVLLLRPDHLIVQSYRRNAPTLGKAFLQHPALLRAGFGARRLNAALPRLACGTPAVAEAVVELAARRRN